MKTILAYIKGSKVLDLSHPKVMGILNVTPDSFSDGGKYTATEKALLHVEKMLMEGADIIDIGGYSSRPGAKHISVDEELKRVIPKLEAIKKHFPEAVISVDTFRAKVAEEALKIGVEIINDISAFNLEPELLAVIARYKPLYILMHMQGTPQTMQLNPKYEDVTNDIIRFFVEKINVLHKNEIYDIIIDPGFGFGKTMEHNKQLFNELNAFVRLGLPVLVGISRKSWLQKVAGASAYELEAVMGAMHWEALKKGVKILRVHNVAEAKKIVRLFEYFY